MQRLAQIRLTGIVFVAGVASLTAEVAGQRLLAPFFGASNVVWANVIGLTLAYLSLGYWIGGRFADRYPTTRALGCVLLVAGLSVAVLPFAAEPLFRAATSAFADVSAGAFIASFVGAMLMFLVPVTALGAVSPWAIRLAVTDVATAGRVAGRLYAVSTVGSILGTFLPVLVLVPTIGTRRTMLLAAFLLLLAAASTLPRHALVAPLAVIALAAAPQGQIKSGQGDRVLYEGESQYQFVQVVENRAGERILRLNEGWAVHSILPADRGLTGGYWDSFLALPTLYGRADGRIAILGNAGGTVSNLYGLAWPATRIDGVEIDGLVSSVGRRYLGMTNPRLSIHTEDARFWLQGSHATYDGIVVDAYRQPYIPFHLVSREFFQLVSRRLSRSGVVAINVGTPPDLTGAVTSIEQTMRSVFPAVATARYDDFNSVVLGFRDPAAAARAGTLLRSARGLSSGPSRKLATLLRPVARTSRAPLTDDHDPIELETDKALLEYLREGAPGSR